MRKTVDLINTFVAVVVGLILLVSAFDGGQIVKNFGAAYGGWFVALLAMVAGSILFVWNLIVAIKEFRSVALRRNVVITTDEGVGSISITALEQQLLHVLGKAADVGDATLHLTAHAEGEPIGCRIAFKLKKQNDVMRRVDELKKLVREEFQRIIPNAATLKISADITDIVDDVTSSTSSSFGGNDEFSGPQYPVNDGDNEVA